MFTRPKPLRLFCSAMQLKSARISHQFKHSSRIKQNYPVTKKTKKMNARQGQGGVNLLDFTTNGEKKNRKHREA